VPRGFFFNFLIFFLQLFFKNTTCHISSLRCATWQKQCDVAVVVSRSLLDMKSLNVIPIFVIYSQFDPKFCYNWINFILIPNL